MQNGGPSLTGPLGTHFSKLCAISNLPETPGLCTSILPHQEKVIPVGPASVNDQGSVLVPSGLTQVHPAPLTPGLSGTDIPLGSTLSQGQPNAGEVYLQHTGE